MLAHAGAYDMRCYRPCADVDHDFAPDRVCVGLDGVDIALHTWTVCQHLALNFPPVAVRSKVLLVGVRLLAAGSLGARLERAHPLRAAGRPVPVVRRLVAVRNFYPVLADLLQLLLPLCASRGRPRLGRGLHSAKFEATRPVWYAWEATPQPQCQLRWLTERRALTRVRALLRALRSRVPSRRTPCTRLLRPYEYRYGMVPNCPTTRLLTHNPDKTRILTEFCSSSTIHGTVYPYWYTVLQSPCFSLICIFLSRSLILYVIFVWVQNA